ncbi:40262_t:CDS:2 [Gigaspora margarita]|uniref:40262_t:CDS:1 n=1 Tax=Gigaspora margarita TaxID=4874 RepID=A0ABN7VH86_GIGMA|nr:40262_t:CDS:2 [Gigaspora margarita]
MPRFNEDEVAIDYRYLTIMKNVPEPKKDEPESNEHETEFNKYEHESNEVRDYRLNQVNWIKKNIN